MLKISDLAARSDFGAGPLRISPSRRLIEGPAGSASLEPIVMKVFLLLLDGAGEVVTRDELFDSAWGGVIVGDDSLNRAIARVRKVANETAPGLFEIETIPRTGYRLTGAIVDQLGTSSEQKRDRPRALSRRAMIGAGAASIAVIGSGGAWLAKRTSDERRFDDLVSRAIEGLESSDGGPEALDNIEQAVAIRPEDGIANGLLAYAIMGTTDNVNKVAGGGSVEAAQRAATISLRANPKDPNAQLAMIQLDRARLDLAETEDRLRRVLDGAPDSIFAMRNLWSLLQSAGRSRDGLALVERAMSINPLASGSNFPLAQFLWITGRTAEADRVIDRAMNFWPRHPYVRFARFTIFAFTGRARAALAMLDDPPTQPLPFTAGQIALWRKALPVLDQPSPAGIATIRAAYLDAVKREPRSASNAVLVLSALGEVDGAFEIANNLFVFREPKGKLPESRARSTSWRFTPWLFIPPTAAMRADPRFVDLCDGTGLTAYWQKRGIQPDYRRFKS